MSAKVVITGIILSKKVILSEYSQPEKVILTIKSGGSTSPPKDLPKPTQDITFSCMVKANLYKKLKEHASNVGRPLVGMRISIKGELYLEMDAEFLNNAQLGVIGFEAEALPDKLDKEPKATVKPLPPRTKSVPLINIAVDLMLIPKSPSTEEIEQEVSYYHQHKMFSRPIFIDKTKSGYRLRKGYLQFAAAKKLSLEEVDTLMFSSEMKVSWDDY